jgi:anti-anti-sigma regulatory factor
MRRAGSISTARGLRPGDHVCWTYSSDDEHRQVLTDYVADAVAAGEKTVLMVRRAARDRVLSYLSDAGHDPDRLMADGRLVVDAAEDSFTPDDVFDPDSRIRFSETRVRQARDEGFTALRLFADAAWLLDHPSARDRWPAFELRAELLAARVPCLAVCGYDLRECHATALGVIGAVHSLALDANGAGSTSSFNLHATEGGGISVNGEVDFLDSDTVESLLVNSIADVAEPVLDVSSLRFADAAGMRAIAIAADEMAAVRNAVQVRGASTVFRRVWSVLGYDRLARVELG